MGKRSAFTLVELVVVVLILGILAAIAAPKVINNSDAATDNGLMQTLSAVRDAIDMYQAENRGALPGADGVQATFFSDLAPYLRGSFPPCPVGAPGVDENKVKMSTGTGPVVARASPAKAWRYFYEIGEFIVNYDQPTASDPSITYDQL